MKGAGTEPTPIVLSAQLLRCLSHGSFTYFPSFLSHCPERRIWRELRYWSGQIFVLSITALLLNLSGLRRALVAMTIIESGFYHGLLRSVSYDATHFMPVGMPFVVISSLECLLARSTVFHTVVTFAGYCISLRNRLLVNMPQSVSHRSTHLRIGRPLQPGFGDSSWWRLIDAIRA
jgi:hypothetical protein